MCDNETLCTDRSKVFSIQSVTAVIYCRAPVFSECFRAVIMQRFMKKLAYCCLITGACIATCFSIFKALMKVLPMMCSSDIYC